MAQHPSTIPLSMIEDIMPGVASASATVAGKVELATDGEAVAGTDTARAITPANLAAAATTHVAAASASAAGKVELATDGEAVAGTDTARAITPANLAAAATTHVAAASTTVAGKIEIATNAEAKAAAAASSSLALVASALRQGGPTLGTGTLEAMFAQHYRATPALGTATKVHAAVPLDVTPLTVTTEITNPDYPRVVTVKGNQAGVAGDVVVLGTDVAGTAITDTIALSGDSEVSGTKAFRTVTSIGVPEKVGEGDTVSVGVDDVFGLPHVVPFADLLLLALFNGAADTGGALAVSATLSQNLYTPAGTPDGAKHLDLYYLV